MRACMNPNGKLLCLWKVKTIETVHEGQYPNLFDNWTFISFYKRASWCVWERERERMWCKRMSFAIENVRAPVRRHLRYLCVWEKQSLCQILPSHSSRERERVRKIVLTVYTFSFCRDVGSSTIGYRKFQHLPTYLARWVHIEHFILKPVKQE